jgi:hypothetical protein
VTWNCAARRFSGDIFTTANPSGWPASLDSEADGAFTFIHTVETTAIVITAKKTVAKTAFRLLGAHAAIRSVRSFGTNVFMNSLKFEELLPRRRVSG